VRGHGFTGADLTDQCGRTFLITGANSGLGYEAARLLAGAGGRVLLACRSEEKARAAMDLVRAESPEADLEFVPLDLADLTSVRSAALIATAEPRIDVLINNAGVFMPPLSRTRDGFELAWGVNHLGHFALTALLLPKLAEAPGARVVIVSSKGHHESRLTLDDLNAEHSYNPARRYADTKLANLLFLFELDRRLRAAGLPVTVVGCHPGLAATDLPRHRPFLKSIFTVAGNSFFNSPEQGAWPTLHAATGPVTAGEYYGPIGFYELRGPSGAARRSAAALDEDLARRVWDISARMTGFDFEFGTKTL
jgi:NAD(P)-dependent dehydrogenase (short-subunit alcohol dehydrogenase family)